MNIKKLFPLVLFLLLLMGGWILFRFPSAVVPVTLVTIGSASGIIAGALFTYLASKRHAFRYFVYLFIFMASGLLFFLFLEQRTAQVLFLFVMSLLPSIFLHQVLAARDDDPASALSLQSYMLHASITAFFFISVVLFDSRFFFTFPRGWMVGVSVIVACGIMYPLFAMTMNKQQLGWHCIFLSLIYGELISVMTLLPHIPLVKGIVSASIMFALYDIVLSESSHQRTIQRTMRTVLLASAAIIASLLTTRWL